MVFTSIVNLVRARGPDEFWRKRQVFKMAAHFYGRRRNCYGIAIQGVHRALQHATAGRKLRKVDMSQLWVQRITAGAEQHGLNFDQFQDLMHKNNIQINKKVLSELAVFEPATFEALTKLEAPSKENKKE